MPRSSVEGHKATTDVGLEWYLNYDTEIDFDWRHAFHGNPVTTGSSDDS